MPCCCSSQRRKQTERGRQQEAALTASDLCKSAPRLDMVHTMLLTVCCPSHYIHSAVARSLAPEQSPCWGVKQWLEPPRLGSPSLLHMVCMFGQAYSWAETPEDPPSPLRDAPTTLWLAGICPVHTSTMASLIITKIAVGATPKPLA